MRQFIAANEKTIEWLWRIAALLLLVGGAFLQLTYARRDEVSEINYRVQTLESFKSDALAMVTSSNAAQTELAKQVALLAQQVAVLASESSRTTKELERTNGRLERIAEQRAPGLAK